MDPLGSGVRDSKLMFVRKMRVKFENPRGDGKQGSAGVSGIRERWSIVMRQSLRLSRIYGLRQVASPPVCE